jgi:hypothetical protein
VLPDSGCSALHYSILLVQQLEWKLKKEKRIFSYPNVKGDILHPGKNFQTESIFGVIRDDILLDNRSKWIHKVACEIIMTWLERWIITM